jgi:hypothetical protein
VSSPPTIKIFAKVGNNPLSLLGMTEAEENDTQVTILHSTAGLLHTLAGMFEEMAEQTQRDLDEIEGL